MGLTIAILVVLGVLLMMVETFLPGMVAGILGLLCVLAGVWLVMTAEDFAAWSDWARTGLAFAIIAGAAAVLLVWLRCFAVKLWHRTFTLTASLPAAAAPASPPAGTEGVALTELRPLGRADFAGLRREVRCEDGFAAAGARVRITGSEPGNLLVRLVP